jgi:hypothetical protein
MKFSSSMGVFMNPVYSVAVRAGLHDCPIKGEKKTNEHGSIVSGRSSYVTLYCPIGEALNFSLLIDQTIFRCVERQFSVAAHFHFIKNS